MKVNLQPNVIQINKNTLSCTDILYISNYLDIYSHFLNIKKIQLNVYAI